MARRHSELIESALNQAETLRSRATSSRAGASYEEVEQEINRVTQLYCTLVLQDAIDDLAETVKMWTP